MGRLRLGCFWSVILYLPPSTQPKICTQKSRKGNFGFSHHDNNTVPPLVTITMDDMNARDNNRASSHPSNTPTGQVQGGRTPSEHPVPTPADPTAAALSALYRTPSKQPTSLTHQAIHASVTHGILPPTPSGTVIPDEMRTQMSRKTVIPLEYMVSLTIT